LAGLIQDVGEGVHRTGEKTEKCSGIDLTGVDWKSGDSVLDLEAGVGPGKLVCEFDFVEVRIILSHRAQRKEQQES
jgi:hypothetical protein